MSAELTRTGRAVSDMTDSEVLRVLISENVDALASLRDGMNNIRRYPRCDRIFSVDPFNVVQAVDRILADIQNQNAQA